jgi:hypothetical protein
MLARRLATILPALTNAEALEVTAVHSVAGVLFAMLLTLIMPGVLFVLGPIVLGVPHLASDLRHLVLRRSRTRAWLMLGAVGSLAIVSLRAIELVSSASRASTELTVGALWIVLAAALGAARSSRWSRAALTACLVGAAWHFARRDPHLARTLLAFGHNPVALVVWVVLFRRARIYAAPAILLTAAIAWGFTSCWWMHLRGPWVADLVEEAMLRAPLSLGPRVAVGLGLSFVFLQSVHYAVWLAWIPQEDRRGEGTPTFAMSAQAVARDLGRPVLVGVVVATVALVVAGLISMQRARTGYLSIATFHAYLELAALSYFTVGERR